MRQLRRWKRNESYLRWRRKEGGDGYAPFVDGGSEALDGFLQPVDSGLEHWPLLQLSEHSAYYWLHGQPVRAPEAPQYGMVRVQDNNGRFIGIGEVSEDGRIAPRRLIRSE